MFLSIFNGYHVYEVPYRFSYQHLLLLLLDILYILMLIHILKKKSHGFQKTVFLSLIGLSLLIFAGRMFFGWEWSRIYNRGSKVTLLPLELCNINIVVSFIAIIINKKTLNSYLYFNVLTGALMSLLVFPDIHMISNGNTLFHYMFFDYWFIHTQLVAIPIVMLACGWYRPGIRQVPLMLLTTIGIYLFVFLMTLLLRHFESFKTANYMYSMFHNNLPILKNLYVLIPFPFVYSLPLIIPIGVLFVLMSLPFYFIERRGKRNVI
jgi:uncharacterized membrane protein YwaF